MVYKLVHIKRTSYEILYWEYIYRVNRTAVVLNHHIKALTREIFLETNHLPRVGDERGEGSLFFRGWEVLEGFRLQQCNLRGRGLVTDYFSAVKVKLNSCLRKNSCCHQLLMFSGLLQPLLVLLLFSEYYYLLT